MWGKFANLKGDATPTCAGNSLRPPQHPPCNTRAHCRRHRPASFQRTRRERPPKPKTTTLPSRPADLRRDVTSRRQPTLPSPQQGTPKSGFWDGLQTGTVFGWRPPMLDRLAAQFRENDPAGILVLIRGYASHDLPSRAVTTVDRHERTAIYFDRQPPPLNHRCSVRPRPLTGESRTRL